MFGQSNQEYCSDGCSSSNRSNVGSRSPMMLKINSTSRQLQPTGKADTSESTPTSKAFVSSVRNDDCLQDHHDGDDDSMFILLPPKSLANGINTQDLLISPSKYRSRFVCDWNAMNSMENSDANSNLESNVCLGCSSALVDPSKENDSSSRDDVSNVGARFAFSQTPPRSSIMLARRRRQFDWGQGTPNSISRCLPEDSVFATRDQGDFSAFCASTPMEGEELEIASPPQMLRLPNWKTPAELPRPLPIKMQLPSL